MGDREWLEHVLGLASGKAQKLEGRLRAAPAAQLLAFTRWVLVMNGFERALYADPDGDLDAVWWELFARLGRRRRRGTRAISPEPCSGFPCRK